MNHNKSPEATELENKSIEKSSEAKKCPYRKWLPVFACLLSIIAITISLWTARFSKNEIENLTATDVAFEASLKKLHQQLPEVQYEVRSQQESLNEWLKQTKASKRNWVAREASYLVKQAIYQLKLDNLNSATELLSDAVNTLNTASFAEAGGIKNQLGEVVRVLKATKTVNRDELISQLDALKHQVEKLPLNLPEVSKAAAIETKNDQSGFWQPVKESWGQIKQLMIIRHHDKPVEPLVTPLQDVYLKQNLQLQLEEASLAVLYRDPDLYRSSLQKINAWVKQFFNPRDKATQTFLETIHQLSQVNIETASPNVFGKLNEVLRELANQSDSKE